MYPWYLPSKIASSMVESSHMFSLSSSSSSFSKTSSWVCSYISDSFGCRFTAEHACPPMNWLRWLDDRCANKAWGWWCRKAWDCELFVLRLSATDAVIDCRPVFLHTRWVCKVVWLPTFIGMIRLPPPLPLTLMLLLFCGLLKLGLFITLEICKDDPC